MVVSDELITNHEGDDMKLALYGGKQGEAEFRTPATANEAEVYCNASSHIYALSNSGDARRVKVNGKVRRWKREPDRIEIPVKYGLYEYATITDIKRVLILERNGDA